ncbi:hypothetical protein ABMA27_001902 [Loxostege sticticalis]|uniref:BTB domain-containing protein n=1 Tax=Loxostege sticticalis TaxID=481309 RepID=A0ABR3HW17_LOXSC
MTGSGRVNGSTSTMAKVPLTPENDWQVVCNDIKARMSKMYESRTWTDCVFLFGTDQLVPAHRNVLAAASPVFAAMFFGEWAESDGPIRIEDIQPETFISMLKYIYADDINIGSFDDACALYYAAHKYTLKHLQEQCLEYLRGNLTPDNCCLAFEFAEMFTETDLFDACLLVMKMKTREVLLSSGFLTASLSTLHSLYSLDRLAIESEMELFEALERYDTIRNKKESLENAESDDEENHISDSNIIPTYFFDIKTKDEKKKKDVYVFSAAKVEEKNDGTKGVEEKNDGAKGVEEKNDGTKDSKPKELERITVRDIVKLIRFLTMSFEEFARGPAVSSLLTQSEILSIFMNINHPQTKVLMPSGFSTKPKRTMFQENLMGKSRNLIKFRFTAIECDNLVNGDTIQFPLVYGGNYNWRVCLVLTGNSPDCKVQMDGTGKNSRVKFILKIKLLFKTEIVIKREFNTKGYYTNDYYNNYGHQTYLGDLGKWEDIKKNYLDNGSLTFDVELELLTP